MAGLTMRDRFFTPRVARAVVSPLGLVLFAAGVALGLVVGLPWFLAVVVGLAAWALRVAAAMAPERTMPRIDPFTVNEPWRSLLQDALSARGRFREAVHRTPDGPLHETLAGIADRLDVGVEEAWRIAQRGETLVRSRREIDTARIDRELARAEAAAADAPGDPTWPATVAALRTQRATADRLDTVIDGARGQLRLVGARLDESVARAIELSAHAAAPTSALGLSSDVDGMVTELEALRQALEETHGPVGGDPAGGLESGPAPG